MDYDDDFEEERHFGMNIGVVVDNRDPMKLGRVCVQIPGLVEPDADAAIDSKQWAWPLGTGGGGAAQRGFFAVPDVGSEVAVWFKGGNVDYPYYLAGHWGMPDAGTEVPTPVQEATTPEDAPKIKAIEYKDWLISFDERDGKTAFAIRHKPTGDGIDWDGEGEGLTITATSAIVLNCKGVLNIQADCGVTINGRRVQTTSKPI